MLATGDCVRTRQNAAISVLFVKFSLEVRQVRLRSPLLKIIKNTRQDRVRAQSPVAKQTWIRRRVIPTLFCYSFGKEIKSIEKDASLKTCP